MTELLEVKRLVKKYNGIAAVDHIDFSLRKGTCFGLIGPNGAGKTTTIEIIEDVISPDAGEILYKGKPRTSAFREKIGIQFQETSLLAMLTVRETLQTFRRLYRDCYPIEDLIEMCHLGEFIDSLNDRISGGQKQRFLLALALINKPDLLFLDEPSTGLDPQARRNLWDILLEIKRNGKTMVLTTHYMEEAQFLCDEIAIMDYGRIIAQGSPSSLINKHCSGVMIILPKKSFTDPLDQLPVPFTENEDTIEISSEDLNACLKILLANHVDLSEMIVQSSNLENVFLKLTGRQLRD